MAKKRKVPYEVLIRICDTDLEKGQVTIVAEFDPPLRKDHCSTAAIELATRMLHSIKTAGTVDKTRVTNADGAVSEFEAGEL